ncbi:hypothetical protein RSWS8N_02320 [Cereibacter sphaeroides WS8N]|nr:hypothetical protein RSWS8N_02320 [Cereibacter sphaeroides WS8N]
MQLSRISLTVGHGIVSPHILDKMWLLFTVS